MPYDGSNGIFTTLYNFVTDASNGIKILASRVQGQCNDIATGLTTALTKDGQTTPTANLPMGGFIHTGVGTPTARNQYAAVNQVQDSSFLWVGTISGTDTYTGSVTPAITMYAAGQTFRGVVTNANTGAATINLNSIGAAALKKSGTTALGAGDIGAGSLIEFCYDGTNFQIINIVSLANSIFAAKGDVLYASAAKTPSVVSVGSNLQTLLANSALTPGVGYYGTISARDVGRQIMARTNASAPNSKIDITAEELFLKDSSGYPFPATSVSVTIDITTSGANGLDTGSEASSTWYYGWVIAKADGTVAGLLSTSATAPTMPATYVYKALVSAVYNNSGANFVAYRQYGSRVNYESGQQALSTTSTSTTEQTVSLTTLVPPIATYFYASLRQLISTSSITTITFLLRYLTTINWIICRLDLNTGDSQMSNNLTFEMPNASQQFFWLYSASTNVAASAATVDILGFSMPGFGQ